MSTLTEHESGETDARDRGKHKRDDHDDRVSGPQEGPTGTSGHDVEGDNAPAEESAPTGWRILATPQHLLLILAIVLVLAAAALYWANDRHAQAAERADEARTAATARVEELLSYDYRHIEKELATEREWLTGSFVEKYTNLIEDEIAPAAKKAKVVTRARVVAGGIESAEGDEVTLVLFLNVATVSQQQPDQPRISGSRIRVTVQHAEDQWRIVAIDPI